MSTPKYEPSTSNHSRYVSSISNATTAVPSASTSRISTPTTKTDALWAPTPTSYLTAPPLRRRRLSSSSTCTDVSELGSTPNEPHDQRLLHALSATTTSTSLTSTGAPPPPAPSRLRSLYAQNYGALLVLLSQFFGSLMNISTRLLELQGPHGPAMHPFQILFVRQSITALVCTVWGLSSSTIPDFPFGPSRPRTIRWLLGCRGLAGFFGVFGMYFSLLYLPLAEATVLTFLAPILTCYACTWVLKGEVFGRSQQWAGGVSLVGVVVIARPVNFFGKVDTGHGEEGGGGGGESEITSRQHLVAVAIALLGVLGSAGAMTSIRAIGNRAHPFLSINYFSIWCTVVSLFCLVVFPDVKFRLPGNLTEWGLLASLGICGFTMQWLLTAGLAYGSSSEDDVVGFRDAEEQGGVQIGKKSRRGVEVRGSGTRATNMVYTQMLFALAGDKVVFGVSPDVWSWIGSGLILAGAIWVAAAREDTAVTVSGAATNSTRRQSLVDARAGGLNDMHLGKLVTGQGGTQQGALSEEEVGLMSGAGNDDPGEGVELVELQQNKNDDRRWI